MTFGKFSAETSIKSTVTHRPSSCIFNCNSCIFNCTFQHLEHSRAVSSTVILVCNFQHLKDSRAVCSTVILSCSFQHLVDSQLQAAITTPFMHRLLSPQRILKLRKYQSPQKPTKHFTTKIVKGASVLMTL